MLTHPLEVVFQLFLPNALFLFYRLRRGTVCLQTDYRKTQSLDFTDKLNDQTIEEDEIVVSYDVTSLFTEIPLDETINHIIDQIYNQ